MSRGSKQVAGMASALETMFEKAGQFQIGLNSLPTDAIQMAHYSVDLREASVGMATLNGLLQIHAQSLTDMDAADWLVAQGRGKRVAIFECFPFIVEELKPVARDVWVFEQHPDKNEYGVTDMPALLPNADIVAITSSTLINHTFDAILEWIHRPTIVMLLGSSIPLSLHLFPLGIDVLSGVQVIEIPKQSPQLKQGFLSDKCKGYAESLCSIEQPSATIFKTFLQPPSPQLRNCCVLR
jgi:uncharacterized protein (DUF4213/DUF364 family)